MKILIVDDSETLRVQLKRDLQSKQYEVIEGVDGLDGLEQAQKHPDLKLVICDLNMPRMDGMTMAKKIHELGELKSVPIIMITTEPSANLKTQGKEAGILAFITKPYVADKLLAVIAKIIK